MGSPSKNPRIAGEGWASEAGGGGQMRDGRLLTRGHAKGEGATTAEEAK